MGAPTSGMICGKLDLVRACYLQNYGIGRAMKVGKEGIVGCMVATETWYGRDPRGQDRRCRAFAGLLSQVLMVRPGPDVCTAIVSIPEGTDVSARALANCLREGDPPVWVNRVDDANQELWLDLRVANEADATAIARRIAETIRNPGAPAEDVPYHDLYWSERRLLEWPAWR